MHSRRGAVVRIARVFALLLWLTIARAQEVEPTASELEATIRDHRPALPLVESARSLLLQLLSRADAADVQVLVAFMEARQTSGEPQWLSAWERLATAVLLPDSRLLADSTALPRLLREARRTTFDPSRFDDKLRDNLRTLLVVTHRQAAQRYDRTGPPQESREMLNLVTNHLLLRGLRGRLELNDRVRDYSDRAAGWRGAIARETLLVPYAEERYGAAFAAGYQTGVFSGAVAGRLERSYGPVLNVEMYLGPVTIQGALFLGVADASRPFIAGGTPWPSGQLSLVSTSIATGWEWRDEKISVTPTIGLVGMALRADDSTGARSGLRAGIEGGAMLGYRIPYDIGTHIDLRIQGLWGLTGLGAYDEALAGSHWSIRFAFALIQRPYRVLP